MWHIARAHKPGAKLLFSSRSFLDKDSSGDFHYQCLNTSFIRPENSNGNILLTDSKIGRLDENTVKTEPTDEVTISQSVQQFQIADAGPSHQDEASAASWRVSTANITWIVNLYVHRQEIANNQMHLENLSLQNFIKRRRDDFERTSGDSRVFSMLNFQK